VPIMNVVGELIANLDAGPHQLAQLGARHTDRLTVWKVKHVPRLPTAARACAARLKEWATEAPSDKFADLDARVKIKLLKLIP